MLKQILPILILTVGITVSVLLIQQSTALKSKAYELFEFVPAFHSTEGESGFNSNLDVYKDGIINAFDVIRDRYLQATKSASQSAEASKSAEASSSASPSMIVSPTPSPSPSPSPVVNPANEYQKILNSGNNPASNFR
jgi:hypothetical protein